MMTTEKYYNDVTVCVGWCQWTTTTTTNESELSLIFIVGRVMGRPISKFS